MSGQALAGCRGLRSAAAAGRAPAGARLSPCAAVPPPHPPACKCCTGPGRAAASAGPFALRRPRAAVAAHATVAAAAVADAPPAGAAAAAAAAPPPAQPWSVLNMKNAPLTPPSAGPTPPLWQAIIEVGGSQQVVSEGRFYACHSLKGVAAGTKLVFERVLATKAVAGAEGDEPAVRFGRPYVVGAQVHATVLENFRDKKIIVFKMKAKKHYRRKAGHRQAMTRFLVTKVDVGTQPAVN